MLLGKDYYYHHSKLPVSLSKIFKGVILFFIFIICSFFLFCFVLELLRVCWAIAFLLRKNSPQIYALPPAALPRRAPVADVPPQISSQTKKRI